MLLFKWAIYKIIVINICVWYVTLNFLQNNIIIFIYF